MQPKKLQKAQWLLEIDASIDDIKPDPEEAAEMKSLFSTKFLSTGTARVFLRIEMTCLDQDTKWF